MTVLTIIQDVAENLGLPAIAAGFGGTETALQLVSLLNSEGRRHAAQYDFQCLNVRHAFPAKATETQISLPLLSRGIVNDTMWNHQQAFTATATAGGASTITFPVLTTAGATISTTNDAYNNLYLCIISGTGLEQWAKIIDYTGATRVATVHAPWAVTPNGTSFFVVSGSCGLPVYGPISRQDARAKEARITVGPYTEFHLEGRANVANPYIALYPVPTLYDVYVLEYKTKAWALTAAGVDISKCTADTDIPKIDEMLLTEAVTVRYLTNHGLPADPTIYNGLLGANIRGDGRAKTLHAGARKVRSTLVQEGNWR
jgi:hypothetical protein